MQVSSSVAPREEGFLSWRTNSTTGQQQVTKDWLATVKAVNSAAIKWNKKTSLCAKLKVCRKALESSPEKKKSFKKGGGGGVIAVQTWWCFQEAPRWSIRSAGCAHMGLGILEIGFDLRAHSWWFPHTRLKRVGKQVSLMKIRSMRTYSETLCRHSDSSHWRKLRTQHLCRCWCTYII